MIKVMDEDLKKKMEKGGSHLKYTRTKGGIGAGLITLGVFIVLIGGMLAAALVKIADPSAVAILGAGGGVLGAVFIILGWILWKRRVENWTAYYVKKSGYEEQEIREFDQEYQTGQPVLLNPYKKVNGEAKRDSGIVTKNWIKLPFMHPISYSGLLRVVDVAAVWHDEKPVIDGDIFAPALFVLDSRGEVYRLDASEQFGHEVSDELKKRNPRVITARKFSYENQDFDAWKQPKEVAELYRGIWKK